jgi:drug/metabolite transporter (DMT)-like permease
MHAPAGKTLNLPFEIALLGLLAFLWGSSYLLIKVAVATIPPFTLISMRVGIAGLVLLVVMWGQRSRLPADRETWRLLLIQAFFASIGPWTMLAWGQQYVDSSLAGVLNSTSPIFVFFITFFFTRHEAVSGLRLAGALLGVTGVVLIVGADALSGLGQEVVAQLAVLFAAFLYGIAAIHGKRFSHISPTATAAGTMICATACLVPLSIVVERPWTLNPTPLSLLAAVALAIFCTGGALLLYYRLVRTLGSMGVASQAYLRAGVSVLLGVIVLGEHVTLVIGLGLLATILGVAAINKPGRQSGRIAESTSRRERVYFHDANRHLHVLLYCRWRPRGHDARAVAGARWRRGRGS